MSLEKKKAGAVGKGLHSARPQFPLLELPIPGPDKRTLVGTEAGKPLKLKVSPFNFWLCPGPWGWDTPAS